MSKEARALWSALFSPFASEPGPNVSSSNRLASAYFFAYDRAVSKRNVIARSGSELMGGATAPADRSGETSPAKK
jgi:hypothetical protein